VMTASGGTLIILILLFDIFIEFDANDEFWQSAFPS
jgi:hypothetical protein